MKLPHVITHKNMEPLLRAVCEEPYFQIGRKTIYDPSAWYWRAVTLEFPLGELAKDGLTTIALVGRNKYETVALTGKEGFNAQGLEGKVRVRKDLFMALMNLRDVLPARRGRIVVD